MCAKIVSFFQSHDTWQVDIGTADALRSSCKDHTDLFRDLLSDTEDINDEPTFSFYRRELSIGDSTTSQPTPSIACLSALHPRSSYKHLAPWPNPSVPTYIGQAKQMDENWIDIEWLKECKSDCDEHHPECDGLLGTILSAKPQWLIDTFSLCIIPYPEGANYIALSYVWGGVQPLLSRSSNISALREQGALGKPAFRSRIPKTVLHAVSLTRLLGERYLWCDALCIIQYDDENKHTEFANMSSIYANSKLTIIAANGHNSAYGLHGMKGISEPRSYEPKVYSLGEELKLQEVYLLDGNTSQKSSIRTWESRAWTFQEYLFSRRQLVFYDGLVGWECSCGARFEEFFWPNKDLKQGPKILFSSDLKDVGVNFASRVPNMAYIALLVERFNKRQLTYTEDALYAFTGIATVLSRSCDGGFISGLPVVFFNLALLWQSNTVKRRIPGKNSRNACLPSWSWVGWQGDIRFWSWESLSKPSMLVEGVMFKKYSLKGDRASSNIRWQSHQTPRQSGNIIEYKWSLYEEEFRDNMTSSVPEGWNRHITEEVLNDLGSCSNCLRCLVKTKQIPTQNPPISCPHTTGAANKTWKADDLPSCFYTHPSEPQTAFSFPLPLPRDNYVSQPTYAPLISCTTSRAWFEAGEELPNREGYDAIALRDENGRWVGGLNIQVEVQGGDRLELIEVAQGQAQLEGPYRTERFYFFEFEYREFRFNTGLYEHYHVMWIKWEKGIAYRQGIGRIFKEVWEKTKKERIDVMLG